MKCYRLAHAFGTLALASVVMLGATFRAEAAYRKGKLLWKQPAPPFAFDCLRRATGNTIVSHLDGVTEFTPDHQKAWSFSCADAPDLKLAHICGIQERRNGNLVLGTWSNGSSAREKATACEITRDGKVVWSYAADDANSMTAFRVD